MDDRCDNDNSMAAGVGELSHDGRVCVHILIEVAVIVMLVRVIHGRKKAGHAAEKHPATKLVSDVHGVKNEPAEANLF